MKKKYFFFDIDGTLTDRSSKQIVPSAQEALDELQANGHFVALATGRAYYKSINTMKEYGLHNMVCCGGGGLVVDDVLLKNITLDLDSCKELIRECRDNGIGFLLALDDSIKCYHEDDLFFSQAGERKEETEYHRVPAFDLDDLKVIYKLYVSVPRGKEDLLPALKKIGYLRFEEDYLIVQHDRKKQGIIEMMEQLNAPLEDVVVFGDDTNDIDMQDKRWFTIALGNAVDEFKKVADYVTDNNVDDGIYKACKKFGWI